MDNLYKTMTSLGTVLLLVAGLMLTACSDDSSSSDDGPGTIVEVASASNDFDVLAQAIVDAELDATLSGDGPFTVFAPTDDAFAQLPQGTLEGLTNEQLVDILTYHVIAAEVRSGDLAAEQAPPSVQGEPLFVEAGGGVTVNGSATVTSADIDASNGVIHAVDQVLFPDAYLDVVGIVSKRYNLQSLEDAVVAADLVATLQMDTQDGYTVFAPTNAAFDAITVPSDQQQLQDILTYHVLPAKVLSGDLQASQTVTTVNGEDVTIEVNNGTVTINGSAVVATADLEGTNGVVHIIDEVLIPPSQ